MKSPNKTTPKENKLMDEIMISVFYDIDNFCKELRAFSEHSLLPCDGKSASFEPPSVLSLSEIMTICVVFHSSECRTFKCYDTKFIKKKLPQILPKTGQLSPLCGAYALYSHAAGFVCAVCGFTIALHWHKLCGFYNIGCV